MFPPAAFWIVIYSHKYDSSKHSTAQVLPSPTGQIMVDPAQPLPAQSTVNEVAKLAEHMRSWKSLSAQVHPV